MAKKGDSTKITGITPKLYIKDDGTDYVTGEEYNGLWSTNSGSADFTVDTAAGYANAGHWKFNEIEGNIAFNCRHRGTNDLTMAGMRRGKDGIGTFVRFNLSNNDQLATPSSDLFLMVGNGGGYTASNDFVNFIRANQVNAHPTLSSGNTFNGKIFFDMWAHFNAISVASAHNDMLYMHNTQDTNNFDRVLKFSVQNDSGSPVLIFKWLASDGNSLMSYKSTAAGAALYPDGVTNPGGFHHVAVNFDREVDPFGDTTNAANYTGFYVDGKKYPVSSTVGSPMTTAHSSNTNAFIGCSINDSNGTWTADKGSGDPVFRNHFQGKIYMAQLSSDASQATASRIANLHSMKFDVPRGPAKVDFSDRFEVDGPNVLQDIGTLKQQMETLKGSFTVSLSTIKVKN